MKKLFAYAMLTGLFYLASAQISTAHAAGAQYSITWDATEQRYRVYATPDFTNANDYMASAQITIKFPHSDIAADQFSVTDANSVVGNWSELSLLRAGTGGTVQNEQYEDPNFDYWSVGITGGANLDFIAGQPIELFNFKNSGACLGDIFVMPENDPLNQFSNSTGLSTAHDFDINSQPGSENFNGITGGPASCNNTNTNNEPVAYDDTITQTLAAENIIDVLANDSDVDGDSLILSAVDDSNLALGSVSIENNKLVYTSDDGLPGTEILTYTVIDGEGGSSTATLTLTLIASNSNPQGGSDSAEVIEDQTTWIDVLANDSDTDGDNLTISAVSNPSYGSAMISGGQIRYIPNAGYTGADSFTYTVTDGRGGSDTVTVNVTVSARQGSCSNAPPSNAQANKVYYRVGWDKDDERYRIYMYPGSVPSPNENLTAFVSLKVPYTTAAEAFTVAGSSLEAIDQTLWNATSSEPEHGPSEDPDASYLSFSANFSTAGAINWQQGQEVEVFSFKSSSACLGAMSLVRDNDPYASNGTINITNQFANQGWQSSSYSIGEKENNFGGIYGCPADCKDGNAGGNSDRDGDGLTDEQEEQLGTNPDKSDTDGDGIDDATEIKDPNNPQDTDNDGKNNAIDEDDDGDGLLSKYENYDNDENPANDDTDKDGIPNYLDTDDDNDGKLTKNETADKNGDGNPDDANDQDKDSVPDYLDSDDSTTPTPGEKVAIPTLTEWAQILLALLLAGFALRSGALRQSR